MDDLKEELKNDKLLAGYSQQIEIRGIYPKQKKWLDIWKIIFQRSQTLLVAFNGNCERKRMPDTYDYHCSVPAKATGKE